MTDEPHWTKDDQPTERCPCKPYAMWFRVGDEWVCLECGAVKVNDEEED